MLQASVVTIAGPSRQFADLFPTTTNCVVVSFYVHSLQSMVVASKKHVSLSDPPHKGQVTGPVTPRKFQPPFQPLLNAAAFSRISRTAAVHRNV